MRWTLPVLFLAGLAGTPAQPPPPSVSAAAKVVTTADTTAKLQSLIDSGKPIPPGEYRTGPLFVDRPGTYLNLRGVTLRPEYVAQPVLLLGVRRVDLGGQKVERRHRPDGFGVVDATLAPGKGQWFGLRTCADTSWQASGSSLSAGPQDNGVWPGWATVKGLTAELKLQRHTGRETHRAYPLLGLGIPLQPYPWTMAVTDDGNLMVQLRMGPANDYGTPWYWGKAELPDDTLPHDVRWAHDLDAGRSTLIIDGRPVKLSGPLGGVIPSGRFAPHLGQYPLWLGCGPSAPQTDTASVDWRADLTVWAARVSDVARADTPKTDAERYGFDASAVWTLDGNEGTPSRLARFKTRDWGYAWAFAFPCKGQLGGVEDITVDGGRIKWGGPGIGLGNALQVTLRDCWSEDGLVGMGSVGAGFPTYPVYAFGCRFGGFIEAVGLTNTEFRAYGVNLSRGGTYFARFSGCNTSWYGGMTNGLGKYVAGVLYQSGLWGGDHTVLDVQHDNEGGKFTRAAWVVDGGLKVFSRNTYHAGLAPGASEWLTTGPGATLDVVTPALPPVVVPLEPAAPRVR